MFKKAEKRALKLRLAIDGPSGSGKTFSALKIATGLVGEGGKICLIDTENNSASLYADLFDFDVGELSPPYTPEKFIEYLRMAESAGYDCVIMDSISHEWKGAGGILDIHGKSGDKNSYTAWNKITPRHDMFLQAIVASSVHVIATMRSKQGYVLEERNRKQVPVKVGMEPVQRDGIEYEFTAVFSMGLDHEARCTKDRTQMFAESFTPDEATGIKLLKWLNEGKKGKKITVSARVQHLHACSTMDELAAEFKKIMQTRGSYTDEEIAVMVEAKNIAKAQLNGEDRPARPIGDKVNAETSQAPPQKPSAPPEPPASSRENLDTSNHPKKPDSSKEHNNPPEELNEYVENLKAMRESGDYEGAIEKLKARGVLTVEALEKAETDPESAEKIIDLLDMSV